MSQLDAIVSLQTTLTSLVEARNRIAGIPEWMAEIHEEYSARKAEIDSREQEAEEADRLRREAEGELQDAQQKLEHYQGQISKVSTQREYGALLKEIDTVKEKIKESEDRAVSALEVSETARSQAEELREASKDLEGRYQIELAKWEEEKPGVEKLAGELEVRAEELREEVPRGLLSLFQRLYDRTQGEALARVVRVEDRKGVVMWHCGACNFNVRPQTLVQVKGGEIHHCDTCKRILYWEDSDEDAS